MDPIVAKYASAAVPRYTSYPTAPHFTKGFPASTYRDWLSRLDPSVPASLYLHIPFCRQMCWYCGCNMKLAVRYDPVADYAAMLHKEIELVAGIVPGRLKVGHVHFGGGTPTALSPADLEHLMRRLHATFDILPDAELAIESDPRTLSDAMVERIGALGFNRASFGIQEFSADVQAAINRIQPPDMVRRSVDGLREAGVKAINFDLIYGLPRQTVAGILRTVDLSVAMAPDRFALFGYAHVPWMAKNQRMIPEEALPDAAARAAQAEQAAEALIAAGYEAIGLDHFAKSDDALAVAAQRGTLRRNFQGYTTDQADTLLGFGATAIGRTPFGYVQNIAEVGAWSRTIGTGLLPIAKGHALSADDHRRADVIERLMCDGTVDLGPAASGWAVEGLEELAPLAADGLLTISGSRVTMTDRGLPLIRVAAAAFDGYRKHGTARHSVAL